MDYSLERYHQAQANTYVQALREVKAGRKTSHWMWYIFPQLISLGQSDMAYYYGISGLAEAKAYLADPLLGARLCEISSSLLSLETRNAEQIFGMVDAKKLRSCMTLFAAASEEQSSAFQRVLDAYYGGSTDELTLKLLRGRC